MEFLLTINDALNEIVWGPPFLILLVGTGLYLTIRLRFFQFTHFGTSWKETIIERIKKTESGEAGAITGFQAITSAMAATIGIGNIAGVATALHLGGPGALFWMWITALVGMATKFGEAALGVKYRTDEDGEISGGVMYYIQNGLGKNWMWLAILYALFAGIAAFGIGNMVQSNTVAEAVADDFGVPMYITGLVAAVLVALVILGGIKRIAQVAEILVPIMTVVYILGALVIILMHLPEVPGAFRDIFVHALNPGAAGGGAAGAGIMVAIRYGVARGIFSNEAGLGAASIVHAQARNTPAKQGMWGIWEVFIDTILVGTMTALAILVTGALESGETGAVLTSEAFNRGLPGPGGVFITIAIMVFAYTTMLTWSFYGEKSWEYIFGPKIRIPYRIIFLILIFTGAVGALEVVWDFADTMNGLMAAPNLIALIALGGVLAKEKDKYINNELDK
ncbi:alanine/glycine:cation symporter family protein [Natranaerobius thermophilus]|uniref:Amino acid carrier protein n=1 Tax=Natranaerobius thermophilus (strain ATCC BAA-1301 / DSM 18059 / JW/NM-WN-LF) TaxID=457570 RepID=B2A2U9_NATTJ|nr:sodium:alanine symporter family protein [Natranaerobius thermophilus]ACB86317.1 amino acid carrier protein [Natranaerobius thermophilus JW/NM-WN-LF]